MTADQLCRHPDGRVTVTLDSAPVELPDPLDRLVIEQLAAPGQASYPPDKQRWLFPGAIPGRHLSTVNSWLDPFEPSTVVRMFAVVRAVCTYAVDNELRANNPCRKIELPETKPRESQILDRPDAERLAEAVGEYRPMVYLALMGPRWGEIAGLRVGQLRLSGADPAVTIRLQRTRGEKGQMISSTPKSRNSERSLAIPEWLGSMVADHLSARGDVSEDDYVFVSPEGAPLHYSNWRRRVWVPAVEKIGLPDLHFHDLRHVAATRLDEVGVGDKIKERRMGATKAVVDRVYTQGTDPADRAAADLVGEIFRPRSRPPA